jgi:hypothetical protein
VDDIDGTLMGYLGDFGLLPLPVSAGTVSPLSISERIRTKAVKGRGNNPARDAACDRNNEFFDEATCRRLGGTPSALQSKTPDGGGVVIVPPPGGGGGSTTGGDTTGGGSTTGGGDTTGGGSGGGGGEGGGGGGEDPIRTPLTETKSDNTLMLVAGAAVLLFLFSQGGKKT